MVSLPTRFYRGVVNNGKNFKHPNFRFVMVDTIKEIKDINGEYYLDCFQNAEEFLTHDHSLENVFYGVYGSYWIDIPKSSIKLCETLNLSEAIHIAQEIMGNTIVEVY